MQNKQKIFAWLWTICLSELAREFCQTLYFSVRDEELWSHTRLKSWVKRARGETWEIIDLEKLCNVISFWKHKWILDEWNIDNLIGNIFSMFYPLQALPTLSIFPMLQYFTKSGLINSTLISFINIFLISGKQIAYQLWRLLFTRSIFSVSCSGSAFSKQISLC